MGEILENSACAKMGRNCGLQTSFFVVFFLSLEMHGKKKYPYTANKFTISECILASRDSAGTDHVKTLQFVLWQTGKGEGLERVRKYYML